MVGPVAIPGSHEGQVARSVRISKAYEPERITHYSSDLKASTVSPRDALHVHAPISTVETNDFTSVGWQERFHQFMLQCAKEGVGDLRGNTLNLGKFRERLPACVEAGLVSQVDCDYILHGLTYGFHLHVDESKLPGKHVNRNYKSAYESKGKVHDALIKRVRTGKTLKLGDFYGKASDLPGVQGRTVAQGRSRVEQHAEGRWARPFECSDARVHGSVARDALGGGERERQRMSGVEHEGVDRKP